VQPYSLELTLGNEYRTPRSRVGRELRRLSNWLHGRTFETAKALENDLRWNEPIKANKITIHYGQFVLLHSAEYINMPHNACGLLLGNSTEARNGFILAFAGWFESEFNGQAVYEGYCMHPQPVTLYAGERLGQMAFFMTVAPAEVGYNITGRYNGQRGAQVAR